MKVSNGNSVALQFLGYFFSRTFLGLVLFMLSACETLVRIDTISDLIHLPPINPNSIKKTGVIHYEAVKDFFNGYIISVNERSTCVPNQPCAAVVSPTEIKYYPVNLPTVFENEGMVVDFDADILANEPGLKPVGYQQIKIVKISLAKNIIKRIGFINFEKSIEFYGFVIDVSEPLLCPIDEFCPAVMVTRSYNPESSLPSAFQRSNAAVDFVGRLFPEEPQAGGIPPRLELIEIKNVKNKVN
jgi:hypothetical protein